MNEEQLINKIQELKTITPNSDWVLANKKELLGEEKRMDWSLFFRPALVGASVFAIMIAFNVSQDSLPGELLFTLKRLTEDKDTMLCANDNKTSRNFELANRRLEELFLIAESNEVKKIAPAISEFQSSIKDVTKELAKVYITGGEIGEALMDEASRLEEAKEIVGQTLASEFGGEVYDEYMIAMARLRIKAAEDILIKLKLITLDEDDNNRIDQMGEDLGLAKEYLDDKNYNPGFKIISEILIEISDLMKEKQIQ